MSDAAISEENSLHGSYPPWLEPRSREKACPLKESDSAPRVSETQDGAELWSAIGKSTTIAEMQLALGADIHRHLNCVFAAWYSPAGDRIGQEAELRGLFSPADGISVAVRKQILDTAAEASEKKSHQISRVTGSDRLQILTVPFRTGWYPGTPQHACLVAIIESGEPLAGDSHPALLLKLTASQVECWLISRSAAAAANDANDVAAMIELTGRVSHAGNARDACRGLADSLLEILTASRVCVGLCDSSGANLRVMAISGQDQFDSRTEQCRLIEAALTESLVRSAGAIWPCQSLQNRHSLLAHQQLATHLQTKTLVTVPMLTSTGLWCGAILAEFDSDGDHDSSSGVATAKSEGNRVRALRFLNAAAPAISASLDLTVRLQQGQWLVRLLQIRRIFSRQKLKAILLTGISTALCLFVPMPYRIHCSGELQPVERRYIAAPFSGPLQKSLVEPGDLVQSDQLLAVMDGREVQWELAGIQADLHKAMKERNTQLSTHEFGSAAISAHEIQRLQNRTELLQHRDLSLEIRSPVNGIVVSGDLKESEGVPLKTGQTLFEVALLDRMSVEIAVPEVEVRHIRPGMVISMQPDSAPEQILYSTIRRIHPRAELRDNENVFVAEAELMNPSQQLRPGMRAQIRIESDRHSVGWNLFHKPIAHLMGWMGW